MLTMYNVQSEVRPWGRLVYSAGGVALRCLIRTRTLIGWAVMLFFPLWWFYKQRIVHGCTTRGCGLDVEMLRFAGMQPLEPGTTIYMSHDTTSRLGTLIRRYSSYIDSFHYGPGFELFSITPITFGYRFEGTVEISRARTQTGTVTGILSVLRP